MTLKEIEKTFGIDYRTLMRWIHEKVGTPEWAQKRRLLVEVLMALDEEFVCSIRDRLKKREGVEK